MALGSLAVLSNGNLLPEFESLYKCWILNKYLVVVLRLDINFVGYVTSYNSISHCNHYKVCIGLSYVYVKHKQFIKGEHLQNLL
jgi:hypothetical protein